MFAYKVLKKCYINDKIHEPGGKHPVVHVKEKFKEVPSSLEFIGEVKPAKKADKE